MEGEDSKSDDKRAFGNQAVWKRMIVVCAGAVMNIILGFILALVLSAQQPAFASNRIQARLQTAGLPCRVQVCKLEINFIPLMVIAFLVAPIYSLRLQQQIPMQWTW